MVLKLADITYMMIVAVTYLSSLVAQSDERISMGVSFPKQSI